MQRTLSNNKADQRNFNTKIYFLVTMKRYPILLGCCNISVLHITQHKSYLVFLVIFRHQSSHFNNTGKQNIRRGWIT